MKVNSTSTGRWTPKSLEESKCSSRNKEHERNCKTRWWFDYCLGLHGSNWSRNLVIFEGIMNQYSYLNIFKNNLSPSASKLGLDGSYTLQQDNDTKDTARVVRKWLLYNVREQVKTIPQSPDLNSIEHLWNYLDRQIRKQEIKTKNDLKKALLEEWQKIPSSVTQNLVKSVPSRLRAVIKAKGYPTNL
ncbi:transposable element Tcb1 transposase [Trichonephila clavipes]|nr:transposable element Tcb1 transposase [Trichonephila clavipes]